MTVNESTAKIQQVAENNSQDVRDCTKLKDMQIFRQGDIYICKFESEKSLKTLFKEIKAQNDLWSFFEQTELEHRNTKQLAVGDTKGSRHIVSGNAKVMFYKQGHPCLGGVITGTGPWTLNHPDHANGHFGAGEFMFYYQMDARLKGVAQRVRD